MKREIYIMISLFCLSCAEPQEKKLTHANSDEDINDVHLTNTVWVYQVSNECKDTLKFMPNKSVTVYDCELSYTFRGVYRITKDTLVVSFKDDSHSEDRGKSTYFKDKYLIKQNTLNFIGSLRLINEKWEEKKAMENTSIIYRKVD